MLSDRSVDVERIGTPICIDKLMTWALKSIPYIIRRPLNTLSSYIGGECTLF